MARGFFLYVVLFQEGVLGLPRGVMGVLWCVAGFMCLASHPKNLAVALFGSCTLMKDSRALGGGDGGRVCVTIYICRKFGRVLE